MDPHQREKTMQERIESLEKRITVLEKENELLGQKAREADSASRAKSDFLAMISHEIRTPMNGVIGLSELLLGTELKPRQKHFAQLIKTSAGSLLTLINSLLDFSKIEAEKMALEIDTFDLRELLEQLIGLYGVTGKQKGLYVGLQLDEKLADHYLGDAYRLRQVLVNLLGNSIKFTDQGSVILTVSLAASGRDGHRIQFTVSDTGVGIDPTMADELFQPFTQFDTSSTRRYGGSGLGLSICAKLVELMGGEIGFESEVGKGTVFKVSLTLMPADEDQGKECVPETGEQVLPPPEGAAFVTDQLPERSGTSILIVDDDSTNRVVMGEILATTPALIKFACNGREAFDWCRTHCFQLIFMDCRMPEMDGFEASKAILEHYRTRSMPTPSIVALTADATTATRERCFSVGMADYLVKPIDFERLYSVLSTWLPELNLSSLDSLLSDEEAPEQGSLFKETVVDMDVLNRLQQHVGSIDHVVRVYLGAMKKRLTHLKRVTEKGDMEEVGKVAHMLKGSSSQVGAEELANLCMMVEQAAEKNNSAQVEHLVSRIRIAVERVEAFFQERLD